MLIESKIRREGGSHIDIAGVDYHFKADTSGVHVCDVTDEAAIARLLAIPEGFRLVSAVLAPTAAPASGQAVAAVKSAPAASAAPESGMVLIGDNEQRVDLMAMNKRELLAFAKDKFKVDAMASAQALRESIYQQAKG
jgi:hypothetical protein